MTNSRDVEDLDIAESFRGILRVSPNVIVGDNQPIDEGIPTDGSVAKISDSAGVFSPVSIGTNRIKIENASVDVNGNCLIDNNGNINVKSLKVSKDLIIGNATTIPSEAPKDGMILIGRDKTYKQEDLVTLVTSIINSGLGNPTGTIITGLYNNEPEDVLVSGKKSYLFLNGQEVSKTIYKDLYDVLRSILPESDLVASNISDFKLPDIEGDGRYLLPSTELAVKNSKVEASLPNISGELGYGPGDPSAGFAYHSWSFQGNSLNGAFGRGEETTTVIAGDVGVSSAKKINFDASRSSSVYKNTATTVTPKSFRVRALIKT